MAGIAMNKEIKWWKQRVKNFYHLAVSIMALAKYGYPARKLFVIGVTGTDGKTTTSTLVYEVLRAAGGKVKPALLSTVAAKIGDEEIDTGLHTTNPDARLLQPLISRMAKEGVTHLVLEVTAHGIDQHRILGTNISIGVLTNITHEHLDDFVDMRRYINTKLYMFRRVKWAVLNANNSVYGLFSRQITSWGGKVIGYKRANFKDVSPALSGEYNQENLGAVLAVARILSIPENVVKKVAREFVGVPGRREEVKAGQKFRVIVDFAHTPNALRNILASLRSEKNTKAKLIVVFGCTGERDMEKRPMMGAAAAELADIVIVTSDDTRSEDQNLIYKQIAAGVSGVEQRIVDGTWIKENDRKKAIEMAIKTAKPGDIILLAGKGHEKSILIGKVERPWSDTGIAKELILE
ncbi:MAG: UDP-N-acetylmuramoyl-L-alanyl-D-glutamate--2,6-diaminopimelate ligase [Patescibacteria group bacterium]